MGTVAHFFTYETHIKRRWVGKTLIDVLVKEFRTRNKAYYTEAIDKGVITVNSKNVPKEYVLRDLDILRHTVHIHEPAPPPIKILKEEEEYVVVNKPPGIHVHPTGGYFHYTVTQALFPDRKVGCVNRLDLPVSGILILVLRNNAEVHSMIEKAQKTYVAKVLGEFPEHADVDMPILTREGHEHTVDERGKPSRTIFRRIKHKDGHSLVECQPITGRTHQIRIHLKHLGYPIINDLLYGPKQDDVPAVTFPACNTDISEYEDKTKYGCIVKHCEGENNRTFSLMNSFICLHAWKYEFNGKIYEAEWPSWTEL